MFGKECVLSICVFIACHCGSITFSFHLYIICDRSYGMFLYEISTGRGFFDGYTAEKITKMLPDFEPNVDNVPDPQLADLISKCLAIDPKSRPSFVRISRHPYFAANKTPFDFLFGSSI
jgi:serine/threonine protein kinase